MPQRPILAIPTGALRRPGDRFRWLVRLATIITVVCLATAIGPWGSQSRASLAAAVPPDAVESLLAQMSVPEKIGQLMLVGFSGTGASGALAAVAELHVGGIVIGGTNASSAEAASALTDGLQRLAEDNGTLPLMIAIDHEGGPVQRLREGMSDLGPNWYVGQIQPLSVAVAAACERGVIHGRELARVGVQMNLAPVLDVWDNPANTVIRERAYSDDPAVVAQLGAAYVEALQAQGVLGVGKHFPGHGSSAEDSHVTLPIVRHTLGYIETHELVPFQAAIEAGVAGIMTDHVSYPLVDDAGFDRPASLSYEIATDLLRGEMGFDGLVITDDIGAMQAITRGYEPGSAAVAAIRAGSDLLIVVGPIDRQRRMVQAIGAEIGKTISEERLNASVRRVLRAKQRAGLFGSPRITAPAGSGIRCAVQPETW